METTSNVSVLKRERQVDYFNFDMNYLAKFAETSFEKEKAEKESRARKLNEMCKDKEAALFNYKMAKGETVEQLQERLAAQKSSWESKWKKHSESDERLNKLNATYLRATRDSDSSKRGDDFLVYQKGDYILVCYREETHPNGGRELT